MLDPRVVAVSVEYIPPDDELGHDGDLDELLDLAAELGELALVEEAPAPRHLPAVVYPRQWIPIPWRKPLAVSGGLLLVGVVGGILFHTLGPDSYSSLPFTQPQALLGPAADPGDPGRFPTLAALPRPPATAPPKVVVPAISVQQGSGQAASSTSGTAGSAGSSQASDHVLSPPMTDGPTFGGPNGGDTSGFNPFPGATPFPTP